jgi:FKBP-type peptidyl-prolyl cis-trans isomerase FklB
VNVLFKVVVGIVVLATILVAEETSKNKATADAAGSKKEAAQNATGVKKQAAPDAGKHALTEREKRGYALGVELGSDVARQQMEVDPKFLMQGMADGFSGGKLLMTVEDINAILAEMQKEQRGKIELARKEFAEKNRQDGEAFLAANKAKDGIVALPSGLQYRVLKEGDGQKPGLDDNVRCNYRGTLLDGTEIDSSYQRKEPSAFPMKGVIKGWSEALQLMPVGSKWQIFVPSELAYGERGNGRNIGPNATLIFEVELLSIQNGGAEAKPKGSL